MEYRLKGILRIFWPLKEIQKTVSATKIHGVNGTKLKQFSTSDLIKLKTILQRFKDKSLSLCVLGSFIQIEPLSSTLCLSRVMESLNLLRYVLIRDEELRTNVSKSNTKLSVNAWLGQDADHLFCLPLGRCVGRVVQDQRGIPKNAACMYQHIKSVLFLWTESTEGGPKAKSKR